MAMAGEIFNENGLEMDEKCILQLQALIRGYLSRRKFQQVKDDYENIFSEIEGTDRLFVSWSRETLCLPKTQRSRPVRKAAIEPVKISEIKNIEPQLTGDAQDQADVLELVCKGDEVSDYTRKSEREIEHEKCTAETQTSFIEDMNLKLSFGSSSVSQTSDLRDDYQTKQGQFDDIDRDQNQIPELHIYTEDTLDTHGNVLDSETKVKKKVYTDLEDKKIQDTSQANSSGGFENTLLEKSTGSKSSSARSSEDLRSNVNTSRSKVSSDRPKDKGYGDESIKISSEPDLAAGIQEPPMPTKFMREYSVLTNATSVWDSFTSVTDYIPCQASEIPEDPQTLMEMRKNVAMELLWVQQAINSRKNYLKIKDQMKVSVPS